MLKENPQKSFRCIFTVKDEPLQVCQEELISMFSCRHKNSDLIRNPISVRRSAPNRNKTGRHRNRPNEDSEERRKLETELITFYPFEMFNYSKSKSRR